MTTTVEELERRVIALENAQTNNASTLRWVAGTLGQIQATVDDHTGRFDKVDHEFKALRATVDDHTIRLGRVEHEIKSLRADLPGIVAEAMREVMKESK